MKMTLSVKDVAIYWLNASQRPKEKTVRVNRNQRLVGLNQDLFHVHTRFNRDLVLNMNNQKWLNRG
jgi:hypothetical protein